MEESIKWDGGTVGMAPSTMYSGVHRRRAVWLFGMLFYYHFSACFPRSLFLWWFVDLGLG